MTNLLKKHFIKSDQGKLKRILPSSNNYDLNASLLIMALEVNQYLKFEVLPIELATTLLVANLADHNILHLETQMPEFMTIGLKPSLINSFRDFTAEQIETPSKESIDFDFSFMMSGQMDPYMEDFDWDGGSAEADPAYIGMPDYAGWGGACYLMTEKRLLEELEKGDWRRLLHRTPYKPMSYEKCGRELFDTESST